MKTKFLGTVVVCATLGLASYAAADETTTNAAPVGTATTAAVDPANEVVCRMEPPPLGTRIGRRKVCGTRAEWDAMSKHAQTEVLRAQLSPMINRQNPDGN